MASGILGGIGCFATSLFQTSLKSSTKSNALVQFDTFKPTLINDLASEAA